MGIRSDVGFACKTELAKEVTEKFPWVAEQSDKYENDEGILFHFTDIKWYRDIDDFVALYKFLKEHNEDDYLIVEACHDYPESDQGDAGNWTNNPWNVYRAVSVRIEFEQG